MDKFEEFKILFKKFIDGSRWLNERMQEGTATDEDKQTFFDCVANPMDELWATFTGEEKAYWSKVQYAVDLFSGTVVLDEPERPKRKGQKKKWKRYFRSH